MDPLSAATASLHAALACRDPSPGLPPPLCMEPSGLTVSDVEAYARVAPHRFGTLSDYKRLLPRLLELSLSPAASTSRGLRWSRHEAALLDAALDLWAEAEQTPVLEWLDALWDATCSGVVPAWNAMDVLRLRTRFRHDDVAALLERAARTPKVRRALVAELSLANARLVDWVETDARRLDGLDGLVASGQLDEAGAARRRVHPAEAAVRQWFVDPWRGVELSKDLAGARGSDQSVYRRRLQRWKAAIRA